MRASPHFPRRTALDSCPRKSITRIRGNENATTMEDYTEEAWLFFELDLKEKNSVTFSRTNWGKVLSR